MSGAALGLPPFDGYELGGDGFSDILAMHRVNPMRRARIDSRGCGCAALLAVAFVLTGCSASNPMTGTADTASTSRFSSLFSGPTGTVAPATGSPAFNADDCPNVEIRTGTGNLTVAGKPPEASPTDVRYALTLTQIARQCMVVGGDLVIKVGVQGRIIVGPVGGPGQVDVPLRYAVVRESAGARTIATKFKRVSAEVPPDQTNVMFSDVEENLSFPMPSRADLPAYTVYVGFDEIGDAPQKKPAAKKPPPRK
jgi:hypothetical protein